MPITVSVKTHSRIDMVDITASVQHEISKAGITDAICALYVPHTTAGMTMDSIDNNVARMSSAILTGTLPVPVVVVAAEKTPPSRAWQGRSAAF